MNATIKMSLLAGLLAATSVTPASAQQGNNGHGNGHGNVQGHGKSMQSHGKQSHSKARQAPRYRAATVTHRNKWHKGQRLARNQQRYVINDWGNRGLRAPPRGYHWVRESNNSGDYLLVAIATGLIASILSQ